MTVDATVSTIAGTNTSSPANEADLLCADMKSLAAQITDESSEEIDARATEILLAHPAPPGYESEIAVLRNASSSEDDRLAASEAFGEWFQISCMTPSEADTRLVPSIVPNGLLLCEVYDGGVSSDRFGDATPAPTVWGDPTLTDPWTGPMAGTWTDTTSDDLPVHDDAEPAIIQGTAGYIAPMPLFQAISSAQWGYVATWRDVTTGVIVEVAAKGGSSDEALRLAELVTVDNSGLATLAPDALGRPTAPISTARPISLMGVGDAKWTATFRTDDLNGDDVGLLSIQGLAADPDAVRAVRFWAVNTETIDVRGHSALAYDLGQAGWTGVIWSEADDAVVQVVGLGISKDDVHDAVASLHDRSVDEWHELKRQSIGACAH